jgi:hypothetical protein
MSIPSKSITSSAIRESMPPYRIGANLRHAASAALKPRLRPCDNPPDQRAAAPAPNPESAFSRTNPMNPEPTSARPG